MSPSRPLARVAATAALLAASVSALAAADTPSESAKRSATAGTASMESGNAPARSIEIVSLFRSDCAPCRHELTILPRIAERHPDLLVTLLVLHDDGVVARQADALRRPNLRIRTAKGSAEEIMARYGNDRQALPFSVALDRSGQVCGRHYGLLGLNLADEWGKAC